MSMDDVLASGGDAAAQVGAVLADQPESAVAALLQAGRLEQTCRTCGRWESAHHACTNCFREMTAADWYSNGLVSEREARRPPTRPAKPPREYLDDKRQWPASWGPWPGIPRAPRKAETPVEGRLEDADRAEDMRRAQRLPSTAVA